MFPTREMLTPFDEPGGRRSGGRRGQSQQQHNPFEMMNSQMSQMNNMMRQMDTMMGGAGMGGGMMGGGGGMMGGGSMMGGGGMGGMMGGGMMGGMGSMLGGDMSSMMGGGGNGSSYSCSSCCYSSSSSGGAQPHVVQYSSSSHGVQRPGEHMVSESHRNYRDSTGTEKLGVSRRIGDRGRSVVAERNANGMEERRDNLFNVEDGTSFDAEWRNNSTATAIGQARTAQRSHMSQIDHTRHAQPMLAHAPRSTQPQITTAEREAARAAGRAHEQQRDRMIAEAQAQRQQQASRVPAQRSHRSQRGGSSDELASQLAQQEARRAGMY